MIKNQILSDLQKVLESLNLDAVEPVLDHPAEASHGDYATSVALILWGNQDKKEWQKKNLNSPLDLADKIAECYKKLGKPYLKKIEVAPPGFINFWLSEEYLSSQVNQIIKGKEEYGQGKIPGKSVIVEFAHPNTHKAFHIGHLRNISTGESIARLLKTAGYKVIRANYQGDVGMHIAKAIYGLKLKTKNFKIEEFKKKSLNERINLLGEVYSLGSKAFEEDENAKKEIKDINYLVYAVAQKFQEEKAVKASSTDYAGFVEGRKEEVEKVFELWKETRQWSLDYFETIYKRVGSCFDRYYFESECLAGVDLAKEAVKKGVLEESDGAVIFNGEPYGLDKRVFVNNLGLPTYEAKELALAQMEFTEFGDLVKVIHVVGPEQASFFKVTFKVEELLNPERYKDKQQHLIYGWVRLKHGKMSSRAGNVVLGEWLLDEVKTNIRRQFPDMEENVAEEVAVGAVKYSFLKVGLAQDIAFDIEESISLTGNSGPYLQYTYARTQSLLKKTGDLKTKANGKLASPNPEEAAILRALYKFPEIVEEASLSCSPNIICTFIFDLCQKFNLFYQKHPILKAESEKRDFRLGLTEAVGQVTKNGLFLLGISAPCKM